MASGGAVCHISGAHHAGTVRAWTGRIYQEESGTEDSGVPDPVFGGKEVSERDISAGIREMSVSGSGKDFWDRQKRTEEKYLWDIHCGN